MWKIKDIEIKNRVVLAPMAGICNSAFRKLIKENDCGLIFAEMVSDKAISYQNEKTLEMLYMEEVERPIVQQVFGSDAESFVKAAKIIYERMKPDIIDINMGCPVPKVAVRSQAGSALLKNPKKIEEIVKAVVKAVPIPITVKIRSGWDKNSINAVEVAKIIESAGASAITVHGRTRSEGYKGHSDWQIIKHVKEAVKIPVIGNGDIKTIYDAKKMIEETNCDAVMIGRATLGNPYLIKQIVEYIENDKIIEDLPLLEKLELLEKHFDYLLQTKNEKVSSLEIRSHAIWYLKGYPDASEIKKELAQVKTKDEFFDIISKYKETLGGK